MADDEEDEVFGGIYENGHWQWDDKINELIFISDLPTDTEILPISTKAPTGTIEFRDDVDLMEQIRFRRRYQRKLKDGEADVITIQDLKDIAIYTAPLSIMSDVLIDILHLSTTERFLRSLIFYCQYYLQVADEMSHRILELDTKVRTPQCDVIEDAFRTNLADLRLLVAKEYCTMTIGGDDMKKYHHMGPHKKRVSLSDKDARQIETLIRMCVQIVWLALGRRSFNQIELEINRLFKTEIFNNVEHTLKTGYISKMTHEEKSVLLGYCVRHDKKLNTRSPLANEVFCHREIDYRLMGLGVIKFTEPVARLQYLKLVTAGPEEAYIDNGVTVGILGLPRSTFDIMLRPLPIPVDKSAKSVQSQYASHGSGATKASSKSISSSKKTLAQIKMYPDIILPRKESLYFPPSFPDAPEQIQPCNEIQRKKWQNRLYRLITTHRSSYL